MNEEQLKPINEPNEQLSNINLPKTIIKTSPEEKENVSIITKLPEWSIEPPVEIKRGS